MLANLYSEFQPFHKWYDLENVPRDVAVEMRNRFATILPSYANESNFNPTYLIATLVDRNYCYLLDDDAKKSAKKFLIAMVCIIHSITFII